MAPPITHNILLLFFLNAFAGALDVTIPVQAPGDASAIAADHVSLSIEQDGWIEFVGATSRNELFYNSLDNLIRLTGVPPRIRIGGQAGDAANPSSATQVRTTDMPLNGDYQLTDTMHTVLPSFLR